MRRLDLHPLRRLRNPARHLRSLRRWVESFSEFRWSDYSKNPHSNYVNWRVPIHAKLVSERHTTPAIQAEVIQCLVDAAARLHAALPPECRHMPVGALIEFPSLFNSEVTLFVDPDYFRSFKPRPVVAESTRRDTFQIDVEPARIDLVSQFAIKLPQGFRAGGYFMRTIEFDEPGAVYEDERWTIACWDGE